MLSTWVGCFRTLLFRTLSVCIYRSDSDEFWLQEHKSFPNMKIKLSDHMTTNIWIRSVTDIKTSSFSGLIGSKAETGYKVLFPFPLLMLNQEELVCLCLCTFLSFFTPSVTLPFLLHILSYSSSSFQRKNPDVWGSGSAGSGSGRWCVVSPFPLGIRHVRMYAALVAARRQPFSSCGRKTSHCQDVSMVLVYFYLIT